MIYFKMLAQAIPQAHRKAFYKAVKYLASLATVALLVLPHVADFGVSLPQWVAGITGLLTFMSHLADSNTVIETNTGYPAVETQNPAATEPSDVPAEQIPEITVPTPDPAALAQGLVDPSLTAAAAAAADPSLLAQGTVSGNPPVVPEQALPLS